MATSLGRRERPTGSRWIPLSGLLGERGTSLFDPPNGTTFVERSFFANKGRKCAGQNPDVEVRRLLSDDRRDNPGHPPKFYMQHIVHCFPGGAAHGKGNLAGRLD